MIRDTRFFLTFGASDIGRPVVIMAIVCCFLMGESSTLTP